MIVDYQIFFFFKYCKYRTFYGRRTVFGSTYCNAAKRLSSGAYNTLPGSTQGRAAAAGISTCPSISSTGPRRTSSVRAHNMCPAMIWHSCMIMVEVEGIFRMLLQHSFISLPGRPAKPRVPSPFSFAQRSALRTLGERPLVLMPSAMSPGFPKAETWRTNISSNR